VGVVVLKRYYQVHYRLRYSPKESYPKEKTPASEILLDTSTRIVLEYTENKVLLVLYPHE